MTTTTVILAARAAWRELPAISDAFDHATEDEFGRLYARALVAEEEARQVAAALPAARSILLLPILERDYGVRTYNVARDNGLLTLGDLADRTPAELLRMRNLGRRVLVDFEAVLAAHGLRMRGEA